LYAIKNGNELVEFNKKTLAETTVKTFGLKVLNVNAGGLNTASDSGDLWMVDVFHEVWHKEQKDSAWT
jgi:hypothetical protein